MSYDKYIKYKTKYLQLKAKHVQQGGAGTWTIAPGTTPITPAESELLEERSIIIKSGELGPGYSYSYVIRTNGTGTRISRSGAFEMNYITVPDASPAPPFSSLRVPPSSSVGQAFAYPPSASRAPPAPAPAPQKYPPPSGPFITKKIFWKQIIGKYPGCWIKSGNLYMISSDISTATDQPQYPYLDPVSEFKCIYYENPVKIITYEQDELGIITETHGEVERTHTEEGYDKIILLKISNKLRTNGCHLSELEQICKMEYRGYMEKEMTDQRWEELEASILSNYSHNIDQDPLFYKQ